MFHVTTIDLEFEEMWRNYLAARKRQIYSDNEQINDIEFRDMVDKIQKGSLDKTAKDLGVAFDRIYFLIDQFLENDEPHRRWFFTSKGKKEWRQWTKLEHLNSTIFALGLNCNLTNSKADVRYFRAYYNMKTGGYYPLPNRQDYVYVKLLPGYNSYYLTISERK